MSDLFLPIIIVSVIALLFAVLLVIASKTLAVKVDERVEKIREALPGANCGGCGFASCDNYAEAIVNDGAEVNKCRVGGKECSDKICAVMGVEAAAMEDLIAFVRCQGHPETEEQRLNYRGVQSCKAAMSFYGGRLNCTYGCIGIGDCVSACQFDALTIENGIAKVDKNKCTGCLACVDACPKKIIGTVHRDSKYVVACRNHEQGKYTRMNCKVGCIGCKKCENTCEFDAVKVDGFLARIDKDKCTACGKCIEVCPVKCIVKI